jgi:glutamate N-acetyltransferase/amino-acid N-acetyltransferase
MHIYLNKVKAPPLLISQDIIKQGKKIKAVLVNSGNANACTGDQGYNDALESQKLLSQKLNINPEEILISSTGVIGKKLPMEKLKSGIGKIVKQLSECGGLDAAEAILTTDTRIKSFAVKTKLGSGDITLGGICKGSGMIAPNMATMLGFITTDAIIDTSLLQRLLTEAVNESFNKISVDGECSTNDMVVILANGRSNIEILENTIDFQLFRNSLNELCLEMAKSIVADGEGATKLVKISVKNAKSKLDADLVGKSIANSALVKTAIYGEDANWGRILSAAGQSGAEIIPEKISIHFDKLPILLPNYNLALDEASALKILMQPEFEIKVDLGIGTEETTWWTCDLTEQYVKINSDYRT